MYFRLLTGYEGHWNGDIHTEFQSENPVRKRPIGRPGYTWEDNNKTDFKDVDGRM